MKNNNNISCKNSEDILSYKKVIKYWKIKWKLKYLYTLSGSGFIVHIVSWKHKNWAHSINFTSLRLAIQRWGVDFRAKMAWKKKNEKHTLKRGKLHSEWWIKLLDLHVSWSYGWEIRNWFWRSKKNELKPGILDKKLMWSRKLRHFNINLKCA